MDLSAVCVRGMVSRSFGLGWRGMWIGLREVVMGIEGIGVP